MLPTQAWGAWTAHYPVTRTARTAREAECLEGLRWNGALVFADVGGQRSNQRVVLILFHDVRGPAGDAGHDEDRGEELNIEPEDVVGRAGREV